MAKVPKRLPQVLARSDVVRLGKGGKDRYTLLSPQLLGLLREYWRSYRPRYWLFPGSTDGDRLSIHTAQRIPNGPCQVAPLRRTSLAPLRRLVTADKRYSFGLIVTLVDNHATRYYTP